MSISFLRHIPKTISQFSEILSSFCWAQGQHTAELSQEQSSALVVAPGFPPFQKQQSVFALCLAPAAFPSWLPCCARGAKPKFLSSCSQPTPSPPGCVGTGRPLLGPATPAAKVRGERGNSHCQTLPNSATNKREIPASSAGAGQVQTHGNGNFCSICGFFCAVMEKPLCVAHLHKT